MSCGSRPEVWVAAAVLAAASSRPAAAQGFRETQLWAVAVASNPGVALAGLGFAGRDASRTRVGFALAGGVAEGHRAAGRAEIGWHFLLDPARRSGLGVYGGGGLAVSVVRGDRVRPWIQVILGAETAPATRHSVFFEVGFGGGARFALGGRLRARKARVGGV